MTPMQPDEGPTVEEMAAHLEGLRSANQAKFADVQRQGAGIDPSGVLMARLESLARLLLPEEGLLVWEIEFEQMMADNLDRILSEITRAKLTAPGTFGMGSGARSAAGFPFPTPDR